MDFFDRLKAASSGGSGTSCPFDCDNDVFFDTQVTATLDSRQFTKLSTEAAIGVIVHFSNDMSGVLFISPISGAAVMHTFTYSNTKYTADVQGTVTFDGLTWYYSDSAGAMPGDLTDSEKHLVKYPETIAFGDADDIKDILTWAKARKK